MLNFIEATVIKINEQDVILQLFNNQTIQWPKQKMEKDIKKGEKLQLILTSSQNLLNEILNAESKPNRKEAT